MNINKQVHSFWASGATAVYSSSKISVLLCSLSIISVSSCSYHNCPDSSKMRSVVWYELPLNCSTLHKSETCFWVTENSISSSSSHEVSMKLVLWPRLSIRPSVRCVCKKLGQGTRLTPWWSSLTPALSGLFKQIKKQKTQHMLWHIPLQLIWKGPAYTHQLCQTRNQVSPFLPIVGLPSD